VKGWQGMLQRARGKAALRCAVAGMRGSSGEGVLPAISSICGYLPCGATSGGQIIDAVLKSRRAGFEKWHDICLMLNELERSDSQETPRFV